MKTDEKRSSNLPLLMKNTLDGLSESSGLLYLKLLDEFQGWNNPANEKKAFLAANEYEQKCSNVLSIIMKKGLDICYESAEIKTQQSKKEASSQLNEFFMKRWKNNFLRK